MTRHFFFVFRHPTRYSSSGPIRYVIYQLRTTKTSINTHTETFNLIDNDIVESINRKNSSKVQSVDLEKYLF